MGHYVDVEPIEVPHFKLMNIARSDMRHEPIRYRRLESGEYEIFCPECNHHDIIKPKDLKRIQHCQICPACFNSKKTSGKPVDRQLTSFVTETDAVWLRYTWSFDRGLEIQDYFHCLHILPSGKSWAIRGLHSFMYNVSCHPDEREEPWRLSSGASYPWNTRSYREFVPAERKSRKAYYAYALESLQKIIKPNQIKLLKDNLYNEYMVRNMVIFNLDYDADIIKHRYYIRSEDIYYWTLSYAKDTKLNKYYLDYLERNKISFYNFMDHIKILKKLGLPLEKPKDFNKRHYELSRILTAKENAECYKNIEERYPAMTQKQAEFKGFSIVAFKNADEIVNCGTELKNCIGTYLRIYSTGETDLFYMRDNKNKTVGAIEVKNGKLKQAYGPQNETLPPATYKTIKEWVATVYA